MTKKVLVAALLASFFVFVWYFIVNAVLGFNSSINMKVAPNEGEIYDALSRNITAPGRYVVNPEVVPSQGFPPGQPVFGVTFGGVGHEAAGRHALASIPFFFVLPWIGAWMLSKASDHVLASVPLKVAFVTSIGLVVALSNHFRYFGIGGYPVRDSVLLGLHDVALWALIGLVLAWSIKPEAVPPQR